MWTSSPAGTRASHSRRQGKGKERQMTDTSGRMSGTQSAFYDHDSHSWRMWPDTGLWGSIPYSETWPRTGRMCGGRAYELPTLAHRITGKGCSCSSFLPTPAASDWKRDDHPADRRRKSPGITTVSVHFPTPSARDGSSGGGQHPDKRRAGGHTVNLTDAVLECTGENMPLLFDVGSESSDPRQPLPNSTGTGNPDSTPSSPAG